MLRALTWIAVVGALVGGAAVLTLFYLLPRADRGASGRASVQGLEGSVRIVRDSYGVPHISAGSSLDAFLALGFAHAQDRFWQMEVLRRTARGTLSELFGRATLPQDRLARTLGLGRDAEAEFERLCQQTRAQLLAYSAGVNGYLEHIRSVRGTAALELRWLGVEPEPWRPADTLALVRLRSWMLGRSLGASLLLDRLVREIGGVASQDFFPTGVPNTTSGTVGTLLRLGRSADDWARGVGMAGPVGSLGFVVSGEHSESGLPLLVNDPHLGFQLPPLFYVAHWRTPDEELGGGTWPGVPVFWTGANQKIAWGQVVLHASVSDLFEETLHPGDPHRYYHGGNWKTAASRLEKLRLRDGAVVEEIEVVTTEHGPLLGSVQPEDPRASSLALRWTGHDERSGLEALLRLQSASGWEEFRAALREFPGPVSTFLYADRAGSIRSQVAGHLPVRAIETGLLPLPGRSRYYDWRGYIEFDQLPSRSGAESPWLVATTRLDDASFKQPVAWLWSAGGAGERLRQLLRQSSRLGLKRVVAMQRETHSARGVAAVARLVKGAAPGPGPGERIQKILLEWDGDTSVGSLGALVHHVFRARLASRLLVARLGEEIAEEVARASEPLPGVVLARCLDRSSPRLGQGYVERALEETWSWLSIQVSSNPRKWSWGRMHRLRLQHDFERLGKGLTGLLGRRLGRGPFPVPGDADSLWTMHHRGVALNEIEVGPAFRYAVDLADVEHAQFGLAGGQSGHPGSLHYDDALGDWLRGRPRTLWMHWIDVSNLEEGVWELRAPSGVEATPAE
ncbi:MAG: penicillin acylase family protein [Deltaproteobacteria bacterium]|nr:penicillin acylase family protein [Deltaproteobacteria bacterium]